MAITKEELVKIRNYLDEATRPIYFFDDDPDGLSSFLLFYRYKKSGKGIVIKSSPVLEQEYASKVNEYYADTVFVLDKPITSQEFIDACLPSKIVIIDHHEPINLNNALYFNPRIENNKDNRPVSYWCYMTIKQDLWIAMTGMIGDWFLPKKLRERFSREHPELLPADIKKPEDALYKTKLGVLSKIFSFILKGKTTEVMKAVKILTRIEDPNEILNQETPRGKFIYKKYLKVNAEYNYLLKQILKKDKNEEIIVFTYPGKKMSFTGELSNEILYRFPNKINIIGRVKSGEVKCSIRASKHNLPEIIKKSFVGVRGYGGGHLHACGASIKEEDFPLFVKKFKENILVSKKQV
ncbi:MAG: DHH family phosphoesterase [Candidatus Woesearchaeota archaeon]